MDTEDFRLDGGYYVFISPGIYTAKCVRYRGPVPYRGNKKLYLYFELLTEQYPDTELFMALNLRPSGIPPGSKYFKSWVIANKGNLPSRNAVMSPLIFLGKTFTVKVRTAVPKSGDEEMGSNSWYSVIDGVPS